MKNNKFLTTVMALICSVLALSVSGQTSNCSNPDCGRNVLNVSTGWDHGTNALEPIPSTDDNWELVSVPGNSGITLPSPTYVIQPHPNWSNFPNARWVSAYPFYTRGVNNDVPFVFRNCFCVCEETDVTLNIELMGDDKASLYLDGNLLTNGVLYQFMWNYRRIVNTTVTLAPGQHCLEVRLVNTQGVAMGFALQGTVSGANLLSSRCCKPSSRICGTKFQDVDCDGVWDKGEPELAGWQIELRDNTNTVIATTTTDAWGNYCFTGITAGNYTVNEVNQAGWTQTYPATPSHSITVAPNSSYLAHFGNCKNPPDPCDFQLDFNHQVLDCKAQFNPIINGVPTGYQVVSTIWTFGDGISSTDYAPTHYYATPGWKNVCVTVTIWNGQECCTKTFCKDIYAEACPGGCNIDADLVYAFDPSKCHFYFGAILNSTTVPIHTVFWDFGDGTTATGWNPEHNFPGNGTYTVCVTLFGYDDDGCCFKKVCLDIVVDCNRIIIDHDGDVDDGPKPNGQTSTDGSNPKKNTSLQTVKLYPNPNHGGFNMMIDLPQATTAKMTIIDIKGSKVYEKDLGEIAAGEQTLLIDANLAPGHYICEITTVLGTYRANFIVAPK